MTQAQQAAAQQSEPSAIFETSSGRIFDVFHPTVNDIDIGDIARALAKQCRFGGQPKQFYSVAEHSLNVERMLADHLLPMEICLAGLLHDASECYLIDLPRPIKRHVKFYLEVEENMMNVIFRRFNIPFMFHNMPEIIHWADDRALMAEAYHVMPSKGEHYGIPMATHEEYTRYAPKFMSNEEAKDKFLLRFEDLVRLC